MIKCVVEFALTHKPQFFKETSPGIAYKKKDGNSNIFKFNSKIEFYF